MKKIIYILTVASLIAACGQTNPKPHSEGPNKQMNASKDTSRPTQVVEKLSWLDSIEKAHNESVIASGNQITKACVSLKDGDSTISLLASIRKDHRIFGYAKPGIASERLLLLSVFTNDVKGNPFGCKLGAYYDTAGMDSLVLKYISTAGNFVKAAAIGSAGNSTTVYFEKKWIKFE